MSISKAMIWILMSHCKPWKRHIPNYYKYPIRNCSSNFENVFIMWITIHNTGTTALPTQVRPSAKGQIMKVRLKLWLSYMKTLKKVKNTSRLKWGKDCNVETSGLPTLNWHCFEVVMRLFLKADNIVSTLKQCHFNLKTTLFWGWNPDVSIFTNNLISMLFQCWNMMLFQRWSNVILPAGYSIGNANLIREWDMYDGERLTSCINQ